MNAEQITCIIADKFPEFFDLESQDYNVLHRLEELSVKLAEREWVSIEDRLPDSEPVYFYHPDWVDEDFNPKGQREGFYNPNGESDDWTSAKWIPDQDCYATSYDMPTYWMPQPKVDHD